MRKLERAYNRERALFDGMPTIDEWSNLLRALDEVPIDSRKLPELVRLSKRAVRTRVVSALRKGWIEESTLDGGVRTVSLTDQGRELANMWFTVQARAEESWRQETGLERFDSLRRNLKECVSLLPLEYPHYPAGYGAADASITGRNGVDWTGVPRVDRASVESLPLLALLSQALVAFAMSYEELSPVALSLSTAVIRRISLNGRLRKELGQSVGVSALIRHGFLWSEIKQGNEYVHLTSKGVSVQELYDRRIAAVEAEWRAIFGDHTYVELELAGESVCKTA